MCSLILLLTFSSLICVISAQCWPNVTCSTTDTAAFPGYWDRYIYSPATRNVEAQFVLDWPELVQRNYSNATVLSGNGSLSTFDFGKEVGGLVSFTYNSTGSGQLGIAFTEARDFVGEWSDSSNGKFVGPDGALYTSFAGTSAYNSYTMPLESLRGGFRYMTVFLITNSSATVSIGNVEVELDFQPTWSNLRAYQGYFYSSDDLLNKIWYAGAYTLQSNCVPVNTGRQVPMLSSGWANNATMGPGDTIIVDGAKRDRAVWPGDMGIAVPSTFVSLGDLESVKNALQVMYDTQASSGAFAESGPPLSQTGSDTYHMWSMIGTYNYYLYTNDTEFVLTNWAKYVRAMDYIYAKVDNSSLLNVTGTRDWARWQQGFHNTEANMILYHTLDTACRLAAWIGNSSLADLYHGRAASLRTAINSQTWDQNTGSYKDNDTATALRPQDANSMSLLWSVPSSKASSASHGTFSSKIQGIASALLKNWTPIGPETPELPYNISPFISSFELLGRFTQRDTDRALELLRTLWGWYQNNPNGTESTVIEGYLTNGSFSYRSNRGYDYDESYPSHAHGWSAGPTSGLTNYVVGLDITAPVGQNWTLAPQTGNLTFAEGGFVTSLGKFQAAWQVTKTGSLSLNWNTPGGTRGLVTLPAGDVGKVNVTSNGRTMCSSKFVAVQSPFGEQLLTVEVEGGSGNALVTR